MTDGFLIHDQSLLLTGTTVALYFLGEIAIRRGAWRAAIACSLIGLALIGANLVVGRPIDVALGPMIGMEPLAAVNNVEAYARLMMSQMPLLGLIGANLIGAMTKERPRLF